ncbi:MAG: hypothetical protein VX546_02580 [Myxococcota bacterium]|nr:hypothetical protein [Myxococcota bacterium]
MHRGLLLALSCAALGCAKPQPEVAAPEVESPIEKRAPSELATGLDGRIESAMPDVSYSVETPEAGGAATLQPLDGEGVIVCLPSGDTTFGKCVFPLPEETP